MERVKYKLFPGFVAALVAFIGTLPIQDVLAQDLSIRSYVDRTRVAVGQQFVLTIELSGSDAQSAPTPELPDLSSFADYVGSSTSQNIQFINGKMSVSKSTTNYYVARVVGKHTIPEITLSYKGKTIRSQPIVMEIVKGQAPPATGQQPRSRQPGAGIKPESSLEGNLFLRAEVDRKTVFPNQPVIIRYKIYTRVEVLNYAITQPPQLLGFWTEEFDMPQRPPTTEKVINGKRFLVAEIKKVAAFPTSAGEKVINPMQIECQVRLQRRSSRSLFDDFFDDPFFGGLGQRVTTRIASKPITIKVNPLPEENKPANFSGAVGNFTMKASLDKSQVAVNEAVTLKVRYEGNGNIKMLPVPEIHFPQGIESYEPKTSVNVNRSGNQIQGSKVTEFVLIPRLAGDYRIKPIMFSYFDPESETYKTLRSREFLLHVTSGEDKGYPITFGHSREEVKFIGKDIRFIHTGSTEFRQSGSYFYKTIWFFILLLLPLGTLGMALIYQQHQTKMAENVAYARSRKATRVAQKRLSTARKLLKPEKQKEFYAEISRALLGFIADKLNVPHAGLISDEVAETLRKRNVPEDVISEFLACLQECDFQRFAPATSTQEQMKELYNRAKKAIERLEKTKLI